MASGKRRFRKRTTEELYGHALSMLEYTSMLFERNWPPHHVPDLESYLRNIETWAFRAKMYREQLDDETPRDQPLSSVV